MSAIRQCFPNLIQTLHNLGYSLSYLKPNLEEMDRFYDKSYPGQTTVTFESATDWIYSERAGSKKRLRERVLTVKYLSRYLISVGIDAYVPDIKVGKDFHRHSQLFNDQQLCQFFACADGLKANKRSPNREYITHLLFRIIYACGLRNSEACVIRMEDINLERGIISVIHSKGDKDRNVFMDGMLADLCRRFDTFYSSILPERKYFFRISVERLHPTKYNVDDWFDLILKKAGLDKKFSVKPTVHSMRHLFAVKSMKKCLEQGEDFDNWIKYLSKYMGHESTEETMYYLHMVEALIPEYQEKIRSITEGIEVAYEEF